jgi:uncharacterized membrane protein YkoI
MKQRIAIAAVSGAVVVAAAAAVAAYAAGANENDALAVGNAKITLGQAVAAAEQKLPGKAAKAEFEQAKGGRWVYDVEVVSGAKVFDVTVDADTGNVIASVEDKNDRDDDHDEKD